MQVRRATLSQLGAADGAVVVIDVLRSFTTAAYAFAAGATAIFPVGTPDEAARLLARYPGALTMGAVGGGMPIAGFTLSNSPAEIAACDLRGRELIHCTAGGVRGLLQYREAAVLLAASFVCARATAALLRRLGPLSVTLVATGDWVDRDGDEDHACADYLEALLLPAAPAPDPAPFLRRVRESDFGRRFCDPAHPAHPAADLEYAAVADRFAFAMQVGVVEEQLVMTAV